MALLQLNLAPQTKDLRWFAGLWWPLFCGLAGVALIRKFHYVEAAVAIWAIGAILAVAGLFSPAIIRPVYSGLLRLTYPIGFVVSYVLLFAVYFVIFTPVGMLVRLFRDPMSRTLDRGAPSYWIAHRPDPTESYFRQF